MTTDALSPAVAAALEAWAARVRANREQVEQYREATPSDFYAPIAGMFRADPRRGDEPALDLLREIVRGRRSVLDIGAGGGRYTLPLALEVPEVIAVEPSTGMLEVLRASLAEYGIDNVRVVEGRWPACADGVSSKADVGLISHVGYDVEEIGPFLDAMEAASSLCVAVLLEHPPPAEADRFWPLIHRVERAALPALPEFLALLLARGRVPEVRLAERGSQSYTRPEEALAWLRGQLWTRPDGEKDFLLQRLLAERIQERDGRYALNWSPARVGIVTWLPPSAPTARVP